MGIFKSELSDLIIPNVDLYYHVISNPNSIPDTKPIYIGEFKSFTKKFACGLKSIGEVLTKDVSRNGFWKKQFWQAISDLQYSLYL